MTSAREVAFDALIAVEKNDAYLNLVLPRFLAKAKLSNVDAAFATELAYGTSRGRGLYDWIIEQATGREIAYIDVDALTVIRLGAHQLIELDTPPHAAIFETVNLAKKRLKASVVGFVNAALRRISERRRFEWLRLLAESALPSEEKLSIEFSHPIWVTRALKLALQSEDSSAELEAALESDNESPKVNLVTLPGKTTVYEDSIVNGNASPIGQILNFGDPSKLRGVATGAMRVQDQGSQLSALALADAKAVRSGEKWLDLCAGPGGKAVLLAALAAQSGANLSTNEVSQHRAELVATALRHSGFSAHQMQFDGRELPTNLTFDRILLDAPCSGLGALRRRPESRWRKNPEDLKELAVLQRELIVSAWERLAIGGVLGYVTCSPHPAETTAQIEWLLRQKKDSKLLNATEILMKINPSLSLNPKRKTVQLWPHRNDTDAMFIALIEKTAK
jgi:16S rRNA (cytosine967-C5)-methyltransferase